jgi:hypothetical protein
MATLKLSPISKSVLLAESAAAYYIGLGSMPATIGVLLVAIPIAAIMALTFSRRVAWLALLVSLPPFSIWFLVGGCSGASRSDRHKD